MSAFVALAAEALRDAVRRRIVVAILLLSVLSLMMIDGCTSCAAGSVEVNGEAMELRGTAGGSGVMIFTSLGLWICALAGFLASDHLQQTLEDGSANLCLARPVGRASFAFSRLFGALAVALGAGFVLLGATAFLLNARSALPLGPALHAGFQVCIGAVSIGALAMTLSLWLPRLATILLVTGGIATLATANLLALVPREEETPLGVLGWVDQLGPPLAKGVIAALDPWVPIASAGLDPGLMTLRLLAWAFTGCIALAFAFRRVELGR